MSKYRIVVLSRSSPTASQLPEVQAVLDDYKALLAKRCPQVTIDLICAIEGEFTWLEYWPSKTALQDFYSEYVGFSDLPLRLMSASRGTPGRFHFQELPPNL